MRVSIRTLVAAAFLLASSLAQAQSAVDPSGHWAGIVQVPDHPLDIEVDLTRKPSGELAGTFAQPGQGIKALPLLSVAAADRTVRFVVKGSEQASAFTGVVCGDGKTLSGEVTFAEYVFPFTLTRTGAARIAAAPIGPAIGKEFEGTWSVTLSVDAVGGSFSGELNAAGAVSPSGGRRLPIPAGPSACTLLRTPATA